MLQRYTIENRAQRHLTVSNGREGGVRGPCCNRAIHAEKRAPECATTQQPGI